MGKSKQQQAVARLLAGLYDLALDIGWRWDGERWIKPGEEEYEECALALRVGLGQTVVQVPQPAHLGCGSVAVSRGASKRVPNVGRVRDS